MDSGFSFHKGRMEPDFRRGRIVAFDHFSIEIHGEKFVLRDQGEANPRGNKEEIGIGYAGADVTESFDESLMTKDSARANKVLSELAGRLHETPLNLISFTLYYLFSWE